MVKNWLCEPGRNPFNLPAPPEGFLRSLAVADPDIVIFPSAKQYGYWLTRRRKLTAGITTVMNTDKDSAVMARHGLIPVTLFGGHITWGPHVLQWLRDRDTWSVGGWEKAADIVEENEKAEAAALQRNLDSENEARARSMYRTYKRRVGESVVLNDVNRGRGPIKSKRRVPIPRVSTGSAPVPPTSAVPVIPSGWQATRSGLVTPPTS